jgi:hypothetical protein
MEWLLLVTMAMASKSFRKTRERRNKQPNETAKEQDSNNGS